MGMPPESLYPQDDEHLMPPHVEDAETTELPVAALDNADTANEETAAKLSTAKVVNVAPRGLLGDIGSKLLTRRIVLIGGGGSVVALIGMGALAERLGYLAKARTKVLHHFFGITQLPPPNPHALPTGPMSTPRDVVIFDGKLAPNWGDQSWATHRMPDSSVMYDQQPSITLDVSNWGGLKLVGETFDTTGLGYVQCWIRGTNGSGQFINVSVLDATLQSVGSVYLNDYTQAGGIAQDVWRLSRVPLTVLNAEYINASGVLIQAAAQQSQGTVALADLRIVYHPDLHPPRLLRAWAQDLGTITLAFDEPLQAASANEASAYMLAADAGTNDPAYPAAHPLAPLAARYHDAARTVSIALPRPLQAGGSYSVTIAPITDKVGVKTLPGLHAQVQVTRQPLTVACDVAENRRAISPEIYGMAGVGADAAADLGVTLLRWGGNSVTRYNWKLGNAFSAARDYNFENGNYGSTNPTDRQPSGVADASVAAAHAKNIGMLLTIPTIGWVARNDDSNTRSTGVPDRGGPPLTPNGDAIDGYDPTANRQRTSVRSRARKGSPFSDPPDLSDPTVAQDEWVYHLTRRFGSTAAGGVRYYAMDNEPDLWWITHTDIRPAQVGYDQMRDTFLEYATAVKAVDATAQLTGPVSWGWPNYFYSALDASTDNYRSHADRNAHGGTPFLEWWLDALRRHDEASGKRSLDVLDLHFYPQGGEYSSDVSQKMAELRLRSTRGLWDPTYADESWIGQPVRLIPRMRDWVRQHYPGTRIALSEWSWGAEETLNGALALAEVLGIFGREGLDIACQWGGVTKDTPGYAAFKLYGNYDSAGGSFIGTSFAASSSQSDLLSCYATQAGGDLLLMVINKSTDSDLTPSLRLDHLDAGLGGASVRRARVWRFWPDDAPGIIQGQDIDLSTTITAPLILTYTFPASSLTLLRLEAGA